MKRDMLSTTLLAERRAVGKRHYQYQCPQLMIQTLNSQNPTTFHAVSQGNSSYFPPKFSYHPGLQDCVQIWTLTLYLIVHMKYILVASQSYPRYIMYILNLLCICCVGVCISQVYQSIYKYNQSIYNYNQSIYNYCCIVPASAPREEVQRGPYQGV